MPQYPQGYKPTPSYARKPGRFKAEYASTCRLIEDEVRRIKGTDLVLDVERRIDGTPKTGTGVDPGAVVRFRLHGRGVALACDKFTSTVSNLRAIALSMEHKRLGTLHGVTTLDQEYAGYAALPESTGGARVEEPHAVLGVAVGAPREVVEAAFKALAMKHHPDRGGSGEAFIRIKKARDALLQEVTA